MRQIEEQGAFKRDYKRELRGRHGAKLKHDLAEILTILAGDQPLAARYRDHALSGTWSGCFACHIKPDPVLIYRKVNDDLLQLLRLGSHAELRL